MTSLDLIRRGTFAMVLMASSLLMLPGAARADDPPGNRDGAVAAGAPSVDHAEEHAFKNAMFLFLGETWERVHGTDFTEKGFTFGLEYTRRITDLLSVGGVVERAAGDIRGTIVLAQLHLNPVGALFFVTGPGVEFRDGHKGSHGGESEHHGEFTVTRAAHDLDDILEQRARTVFVYRIGVAYEIVLGRWVLAPAVDIDFVGRDEALVIGAMLGYEF